MNTASGTTKKKILIVEADFNSRVGLRNLLTKEGYQVETAADSFEAMVKMKEDVGIGIFDLDLPAILSFAISGWDLVDIFRARHPKGTIIVVSTHEGNNAAARAKRWGIADCLVKPISPSRINTLVKALKTQEISASDSAVGFLKVGVPAGRTRSKQGRLMEVPHEYDRARGSAR